MVKTTDEMAPIYEGMQFIDPFGEIKTITQLTEMSVQINNGGQSLYDFGTSRTVGAIIDALGTGTRLYTQEDAAQIDEVTPDEATADEAPQDVTTAPSSEATVQVENAPAGAFSDFEALATSYISGAATKTPAKHKEPEQIREPEPLPDPVPTTPEPEKEPGYNGETSGIFTPDEIEKLLNGGQVRQESEHYTHFYIATPYNGRTALLYGINKYTYKNEDALTPGENLSYKGFIIGGKVYIDEERIKTSIAADIDAEILRQIPTIEAAYTAADIENSPQYEQDHVKTYESCDRSKDAMALFCKGERPTFTPYSTYGHDYSATGLIQYIESPVDYVKATAAEYIEYNSLTLLRDYIEYKNTAEAYNAIVTDRSHKAHTIKAIQGSITNEKTVNIELANGQKHKVEAAAVKRIMYHGRIDKWYVIGHTNDIQPHDIAKITHGHRILYQAA